MLQVDAPIIIFRLVGYKMVRMHEMVREHGIDREGRGAASPGCRFIGPSCVSEETGAASCVRPTSSLRTVRDVCPCRANGFAMLRAACSRPPNCTHELGRPREPTDRLR